MLLWLCGFIEPHWTFEKHKILVRKPEKLKESESTLGLPSMRGVCAFLAQDPGL